MADGQGRLDVMFRMGASAGSSLLFAGSPDRFGGWAPDIENAQWDVVGIAGNHLTM